MIRVPLLPAAALLACLPMIAPASAGESWRFGRGADPAYEPYPAGPPVALLPQRVPVDRPYWEPNLGIGLAYNVPPPPAAYAVGYGPVLRTRY